MGARARGADFVARAGIPVRIDAVDTIAHNKVMVIDGSTVLTGSFNFTAERKNAENLLAALVARYTQNWQVHAAHSEPYTAK